MLIGRKSQQRLLLCMMAKDGLERPSGTLTLSLKFTRTKRLESFRLMESRHFTTTTLELKSQMKQQTRLLPHLIQTVQADSTKLSKTSFGPTCLESIFLAAMNKKGKEMKMTLRMAHH